MLSPDSFSYMRLSADADGETHLDDVALAFEDVGGLTFEVASVGGSGELRILSGAATPRSEQLHTVAEPQFFIVLRGSGTISTSDGDSRPLEPGSVLMIDDANSRGHSLRILSDEMVAAVATAAPK